MATKDEIFEAWAPADGGPWSAFVKPVSFSYVAQHPHLLPKPELPTFDVGRVWPDVPASYRRAAPRTNTAVIVDLPGPESVGAGVLLAREGFRPVPLFNSIPADGALVDVWPTILALEHFAPEIRSADVPANAPPAFLLDSKRSGDAPFGPSWFDNRAVCFTTDFPSAAALSRAGVERVVVVHADGRIAHDLLDVVGRWSRDGIATFETTLDYPPKPVRVTLLDFFARLDAWYDRISFDRREDGAFGRRVQASSS